MSRNTFGCLCLAAAIAAVAGCNRVEEIVVYPSVPQSRAVDKGESLELKFRMITAIVERPDATWFFKIASSTESISAIESQWDEYLKSIEFDAEGNPTWDLPDGWITGQGSAMRFATLKTSSTDDAIEISVSNLGPKQNLLDNVNRWRGQLGLSATNPVQLYTNLKPLSVGDVQYQLFDVTGPTLSAGMGGPFSGGPSMPAGSAESNKDPHAGLGLSAASKPDFDQLSIAFQQPPGWEPGATSSVTVGRWKKTTADQASLELSLLIMRNSDESWVSNIEVWANQLELAEKPDIAEDTIEIEVAGQPARQIRLDNPQSGKSMMAVMFGNENEGWFVKLSGDLQLLDANLDALQSFLDSIKFK